MQAVEKVLVAVRTLVHLPFSCPYPLPLPVLSLPLLPVLLLPPPLSLLPP